MNLREDIKCLSKKSWKRQISKTGRNYFTCFRMTFNIVIIERGEVCLEQYVG
jgi:hypothetical protein